MAITLNGTTGITTPDITSEAGLTVDGVSFASGAPANTLVTTSGGNVGIGTSSPTSSLVVAGSASSPPTIDGVHIGTQSGYATIELCGTSGSGAFIDFTQSGTDYKGRILYNNTSNHLSISTNAVERMRIDSSGNVGIGTNSPSQLLEVGNTSTSNTYIQVSAANNTASGIKFRSDGSLATGWDIGYEGNGNYLFFKSDVSGTVTERARIDSGGNLLVGKTAANLTTAGTAFLPGYGGANIPAMSLAGASSSNNQLGYHMYSTTAAAYRFYVGYGGTVYATNTTISAISDQRYKENIRDLDVGLNAVMQLRPRKFDWKKGKGQDTKDCRGFIAQEFEQVFPDLIDEWKDPAPEGEEPYKSIRQDLIPVLVKAIQEQQALITAQKTAIETLEARVAALEAA